MLVNYKSAVNLYSENILKYCTMMYIFMSVCMCLHACVHTHACMQVHTHTHTCKSQKIMLVCLPWLFFTLFFEARSLMEPKVHQFIKAGWPMSPRNLLVCWSYRYRLPQPAFYLGAGELNSGSHACAAGVLPTDLSPQLPPFEYYSMYFLLSVVPGFLF